MKILLIGKGKSIYYIKKYLKYKKIEYIQAVNEDEIDNKCLLFVSLSAAESSLLVSGSCE